MILPPNHILRELPDRKSDEYEATSVVDDSCRSRADALRQGRYVRGTGIDLEEAR